MPHQNLMVFTYVICVLAASFSASNHMGPVKTFIYLFELNYTNFPTTVEGSMKDDKSIALRDLTVSRN